MIRDYIPRRTKHKNKEEEVMGDVFILAGLLLGLLGLGPLVAWLLGLFNPIGYMGHLPWSPEVKAARMEERRRGL